MTLKLSNSYAVYNAEKNVLFSGSYQQCLSYIEQQETDDVFVDVDKSEEEYELEDLPINYTFED